MLSVLRGPVILHVIWILSKAPEDGEPDPFLNGLVMRHWPPVVKPDGAVIGGKDDRLVLDEAEPRISEVRKN